ncbi:Hypothetical protein A7982_10509 [Minicystis rosea]|nr:Hypothetical protein A7982_10509 [Minicystis rosea]
MFATLHRTFVKLAHVVPVTASLLVAGCAVGAGESGAEPEDVANASAPIVDGTSVTSGSLLAKSTVGVWFKDHLDPWTGKWVYNNCTGVIVGSRHVVTAAHCKPKVGGTVKFYTGNLPTGTTRTVNMVDLRPGVDPDDDHLDDASGDFADIALLTLDTAIPSTSVAAELPLSYPGNDVNGYIVGRGNHDSCNPAWSCIDGQPNPDEDLRYFVSHTYSSDNEDGHFLVDDPNVNHGDSGGPFFTYNATTGRMRVHGDLYGIIVEWGAHAKYTSIEHHLSWLLQKMSYTGGMTIDAGSDRPGSTYAAILTDDFRRCALACAQDSACKSWSHYDLGAASTCNLKNAVPAKTSVSYARSGVK